MGVTRAKQRTLVVSGPMLRGRHVYDDVRVRVRHSVRWRWVSVERLLTARSPAVARLGLKLRLSAESEARVLIARSPSVVTLGQFVRRSSVRPVSMGAPLVDSWPSAALCRKTLHVCATLKDGLAQPQGSAGPDRTDACAVVHKRMGSPAVVGAMHPRRDSATDTCPARAAPPPAACGRCPPAHQPNSIEDRVVGCLLRCGVSARSSTKMAPWRCPPWRARASHDAMYGTDAVIKTKVCPFLAAVGALRRRRGRNGRPHLRHAHFPSTQRPVCPQPRRCYA